MANRNLTVLNPAGYQEILQAADTLVVPGDQTIAGALTVSNPITINSASTSQLGNIEALAGLFTSDLTIDSDPLDSISIVLGADGTISLSGVLSSSGININNTVEITSILDEDDFASDSDVALATQQSIKAYVDSVDTTFNVAADLGTTDLFNTGETISFLGTTNEIETTVTDNTVTFALTDNVTVSQDLTVTSNTQLNGNLTLGATTSVSSILDEDDLVSDDATALATQQSIKAYVDSATKTFNISADSGVDDTVTVGAGETVTFSGTANEIETAVTNNQITIGLPDDVTIGQNLTVTGNTQINANSTLQFGTTVAVDGVLDEDTLVSDSATKLATQQSIKAYVDNFPEATLSTKGYLSANDKNKLDGIEVGATANQTDAEIKTAYENNADTNAFTDAEQTKLAGIETAATADQTGAEIKSLYEAEADTNAYTDADKAIVNSITTDLAGKADLVAGKLDPTQLPDIAITEFLGTVANETAMLALTGQKGDWCVRSDLGIVYIITGNDPTQLSSWTALEYPAVNPNAITIAGDSGANDDVALGETLTFAGTTNEIETTVTTNQIQIGLPNDVTVAGTLTATTLVGDIDGGTYAT